MLSENFNPADSMTSLTESVVIMATFRHEITTRTVKKLLKVAKHITISHPDDVIPDLGAQAESSQVNLMAFDQLSAAMVAHFTQKRPLIVLCASGIVVRILAPVLQDKYRETPVVVVAEDASCVIPLLGGHRGANILAHRVAKILGILPSITTASDLLLGFSLDQMPTGWRMKNRQYLPIQMRALLAGKTLSVANNVPQNFLQKPFFTSTDTPADAQIIISDQAQHETQKLVFCPPTLLLGIGCERHCCPDHLEQFIVKVFEEQNLSIDSIAAITTVTLKADEDAIQALATKLGVPILLFSPDQCEAMTSQVSDASEIVFAEIGCHSVAEASALAALPNRDINKKNHNLLIVRKQKSAHATMAVVRRPGHADALATLQGKKLGKLYIVGLGPGDHQHHTIGLGTALQEAQIVVGYDLYLTLIADQIGHAQHITRPLGAEQERVDIAIQHAHDGQCVALVCSGDPGIYALASLVYERLSTWTERPQFSLQVLPGITAMQAAAAKLGAPLGHDFAAISLSDLLTPAEVIRQRLHAAGKGDFVISLYNPQSFTRRILLQEAKQILQIYRPDRTPVAICRNITRQDESIIITTLAEFDTESVDMLSLVMIGNSMTQSGHSPRSLFTPRGYIQPITTTDS